MDTETYQTSLSEFRTHLWDEIQLNVATNLSVDREEFLEYVAEQLTEAEEIDDFSYVPYEGFGRRNRRIQIDGYSYSELDECLNVFIATPMTYDEDETLIATDANRYIGMAAAFWITQSILLKTQKKVLRVMALQPMLLECTVMFVNIRFISFPTRLRAKL